MCTRTISTTCGTYARQRVALVFENERLTYLDLNVRANRLAHYLKKFGVGSEVRVGICLKRSLDLILSVLGVLKAGACYVPLDPSLPRSRLDLMLKDCGAKVVLTLPHLYNNTPTSSTRILFLDKEAASIEKEDDFNPSCFCTPANLVYHIFTSGSTGTPKGVMLEHRQLLNYIHAICQKLSITGGLSFATVSTLAADLGNTVVFPSICSGGTLHIISKNTVFDAQKLGEYFQNNPIDYLKITPSHLEGLLNSKNPERVIPRDYLILGGEALRWETAIKIRNLAPHCKIFNHYGPTETAVGSVCGCVDESKRNNQVTTVPLGCPIINTKIYILNSSQRLIPPKKSGELYISGSGVARGYYNRLISTATAFLPDPFTTRPGSRMYRTGDLARWLEDGTIEFLGRVDHQVKIRGYRVEVGEIQSTLVSHPSIRLCYVMAWKKNSKNNYLVAYLVCNPKCIPSIFDLRSYLEQRLPQYMIPSYYIFLEALPLTPNGKVDRRALPEPTVDSVGSGKEPPRNKLEKDLANVLCEILGVNKIGRNDNFFILGGHSISAMQLIQRVRETMNVALSIGDIYDFPTIESLAQRIQLLQNEQGRLREKRLEKLLVEIESMTPEEVQLALDHRE